jgi:hypothetical protein
MNPRKRRLSYSTIAAIRLEYVQGDMPFHPMAENKHWRDNRMYFRGHNNIHYRRCLDAIFKEECQDQPTISFWDWAVEHFKNDEDIKVVWCNVYKSYGLHFITDEAKLEFLLRHGKAEPFNLFGGVHLPIIRRVLPSLIAADIIDVQPMNPSASLIYSTSHGHGVSIKKDSK